MQKASATSRKMRRAGIEVKAPITTGLSFHPEYWSKHNAFNNNSAVIVMRLGVFLQVNKTQLWIQKSRYIFLLILFFAHFFKSLNSLIKSLVFMIFSTGQKVAQTFSNALTNARFMRLLITSIFRCRRVHRRYEERNTYLKVLTLCILAYVKP